jgi:hypothetical protein
MWSTTDNWPVRSRAGGKLLVVSITIVRQLVLVRGKMWRDRGWISDQGGGRGTEN